jgi:glutathione synthase/RimK-type ligase-like ATP-grasp enzyme
MSNQDPSNVPTMQRVAFATSSELPHFYDEDHGLIAALRVRGVEPVVAVWSDPDQDWQQYDAIVIRTIWDYFRRYPEFLRWLERIEALGVQTINDSALLRWNSDKRYLLDLQSAGVPIVPSTLVHGSELANWIAQSTLDELVVKPTVSGGAWHAYRGRRNDPALRAAIADAPRHLDYLVQPFLPEVANDGEWSSLWFGGRPSHAVRKRPRKGEWRVQSDFGGSIEAAIAPAEVTTAAARVLAAVTALGYRPTTYARVDGVVVDGQFLLMELEVIEPRFYFTGDPVEADQLANAIVAALRALEHV